MKEKLTIAFDLDNTLCISIRQNHPEDILKVRPKNIMVKAIRDLKKQGYIIMIFTRRNVLKNGHELTKQWLEKYKIPYDKLITNKPHYDIFIEDRALSPLCGWINAKVIENALYFIKENINQHTHKPKKETKCK